jgi:hypothetical protein
VKGCLESLDFGLDELMALLDITDGYHQQCLSKDPAGYCGTGVSCPVCFKDLVEEAATSTPTGQPNA